MAIILITHNFGIIRGLADKVAVMFRGRLVEFGRAEAVLHQPRHPYTRALIDCVPRLGLNLDRLKTIDYSKSAVMLCDGHILLGKLLDPLLLTGCQHSHNLARRTQDQ